VHLVGYYCKIISRCTVNVKPMVNFAPSPVLLAKLRPCTCGKLNSYLITSQCVILTTCTK